ncbi:hypothetical protein, partial [Martelella radicis]|uniref:hypothetical protein n=1 Tax=Martelella radicis TaxID=1397476 RepID=UPI001AEDFC0D
MSARFRDTAASSTRFGGFGLGVSGSGECGPHRLSRFLSGTAFTTLLLASGVALYSGMPQQAVAQ